MPDTSTVTVSDGQRALSSTGAPVSARAHNPADLSPADLSNDYPTEGESRRKRGLATPLAHPGTSAHSAQRCQLARWREGGPLLATWSLPAAAGGESAQRMAHRRCLATVPRPLHRPLPQSFLQQQGHCNSCAEPKAARPILRR
ncbi:hypothetical protein SKAU_G00227280 [Synaphobranchus kaupii]|uniref:Uncharacterized protein n=1 Tax=Synaphobranchus kaupii TaxID=118154 RepID=A0A9Q1ISM5_SYNKA|nr:hypothetical protein SKAU_G00227280 [Synaphobranchus kaupii]